MTNWYWDATKYMATLDLMSAEERKEFWMDMRDIDWGLAGRLYAYGVCKYYSNQNMIDPVGDLKQIV